MLLTAIEFDAVLISRNIRHMDLLSRFRPDARVPSVRPPAAPPSAYAVAGSFSNTSRICRVTSSISAMPSTVRSTPCAA